METLKNSIHVFGNNFEEIVIRLSSCQFFHEDVNKTEIEELIINTSKYKTNSFRQMFSVAKELKKQSEKNFTFYSVKYDNCVTIYSDFFDIIDVMRMALMCYNDTDNVIVTYKYKNKNLVINIIKRDRILKTFELDCTHIESNQVLKRIGIFLEQNFNNETIPSINDLLFSLKQYLYFCELDKNDELLFLKKYAKINEYIV